MNFELLLPPGVTGDEVIAVLAGIAMFITLVSLWQALIARDPTAARVRAMSERSRALKSQVLAPVHRKRRDTGMGFVRQAVTSLKLVGGETSKRVTISLARAGFRSRDALMLFMFMKFVLPVAFGIGGLVFLSGLKLFSLPPMANTIISGILVVFGVFAPDIFVKNRADKRRTALRKSLPDAIDLLVVCSEAGLSLDAALDRVAREIAGPSPELADELGLTAVELRFLPERRKALENMAERTGLPGIQGLMNTLIQTEKYGTPLANSLRVLANEMRNERLMRAEEKAARLPAILTVPMVVFIMPALFIVLIGPGILKTIDGLSGL